jgi:hypothetical protein
MQLQLADNGTDPYISVPTSQGLVKVREDYFDSLPSAQWEATMKKLAPFQPSGGLSELSDKETRQRRKEARTKKKEARADKQASKAEDIESGARGERRSAMFGKASDAFGKIGSALLPGLIPGLPGGEGADPSAPMTPAQPSGMPKWILPVGIGIAGIGLIYILTRKKK